MSTSNRVSEIEHLVHLSEVQVTLSASMLEDLDKLAERYGFNRANTIRYCIRFRCDAELARERT